MIDPLLASYEAVPYDSRPIDASEIGALETMALLYGVDAPRADHARVLELGCASGGNLIPMAYRYRNAHFVGIDLTPGQIDVGRKEIAALGLTNISLDAMSIADITDDFGTFDYIICHGVYSWVPPEVQDAILRVCSRNLSTNGIAYVSYNTLPGWHVRGMVREMMMYHDDPSLPPRERVSRAREFVDLLANEGAAMKTTPHTLSIMEEAINLRAQHDAHLLHEQLEPYNAPVYFSEFARRAAGAGLAFMAEAKLRNTSSTLSAWAIGAAGSDANVIRVQQYVDFAIGRTFRRSLLCHAAVGALAQPTAAALATLHVSLRAAPTAPAEQDAATGPVVESFKTADDVTMTTDNPLVLAAFHVLMRVAPSSLPFDAVLQRVTDALSADDSPGIAEPADRAAPLASALLQCAVGGLVELHRYPAPFSATISQRPVASPLARRRVDSTDTVPNLRHRTTELTAVERALLPHMDGAHDSERLLERLIEEVKSGSITVEGTLPDRDDLARIVDAALKRLASVALLEA
ncbi:MAG: class I SAM-dependent methyltransferase [Gemmatimonadota bacterium]|nr:class I SAM-dependent methyltransferase [Gemmatimonadota bacterium]